MWEVVCVALAWWGLWRARGRTWGAVEVCLVVLVACESAVVLATVGAVLGALGDRSTTDDPLDDPPPTKPSTPR